MATINHHQVQPDLLGKQRWALICTGANQLHSDGSPALGLENIADQVLAVEV